MKAAFAATCLALSLAALPAAACPDWEAAPNFGEIELSSGFQPDPMHRRITAGGTADLSRCFTSGEAGYVTDRPDFDLYWKGSSNQLTIAVETKADAVLLINAPDGSWHYSDDYRGSNPAVTFQNPEEGLYDIWIGSYDGSRRNPGVLIFTEYSY